MLSIGSGRALASGTWSRAARYDAWLAWMPGFAASASRMYPARTGSGAKAAGAGAGAGACMDTPARSAGASCAAAMTVTDRKPAMNTDTTRLIMDTSNLRESPVPTRMREGRTERRARETPVVREIHAGPDRRGRRSDQENRESGEQVSGRPFMGQENGGRSEDRGRDDVRDGFDARHRSGHGGRDGASCCRRLWRGVRAAGVTAGEHRVVPARHARRPATAIHRLRAGRRRQGGPREQADEHERGREPHHHVKYAVAQSIPSGRPGQHARTASAGTRWTRDCRCPAGEFSRS